jgi:phospholipase C
VEIPGKTALASFTKQVFENDPIGIAALNAARDRKRIEREAFAKIKHVIYVIRENRTYDQVLGDVAKGNGDSSLTIFGAKVTPNGHRLAETFSLYDNLYCDGEVSTAGHQWSDAAYANDYAEKQWLIDYAGKGELRSDTRLTSSPGEYLWSLARKKGLSARVYGEYVDVQEDHGSLESEAIKADPEKYGYSASFEKIFARGGRDTEKVADFLREMRAAETTGKWPNLMVMALPEDHTHGFSAGANTPQAMVANNDWAIGQLVDAVSHSKFWKETAIFIIQDDAQAGPDHVDAHRTVGYVASPYARRGQVDHTMYTTSSMLRTMELILGLPPMSEYDAKATPMHNAFTTTPDFAPYSVIAPLIDVNAKNPARTALARRSAKLNFARVDRVDPDTFNRLLWDGLKPGVPYPGTRSMTH